MPEAVFLTRVSVRRRQNGQSTVSDWSPSRCSGVTVSMLGSYVLIATCDCVGSCGGGDVDAMEPKFPTEDLHWFGGGLDAPPGGGDVDGFKVGCFGYVTGALAFSECRRVASAAIICLYQPRMQAVLPESSPEVFP
jgi:hypothetical protein